MKNFNRIISLFVSLFLIFTIISGPVVLAEETSTLANSVTYKTGSYQVEVPNTEGQTYNAKLGIVRKYYDGAFINSGDEVYHVEVRDANGAINTSLSGEYKFANQIDPLHNNFELATTVAGVPAGSTVKVYDINVEKEEYDSSGLLLSSSYNDTSMATVITNADPNSGLVVTVNEIFRLKKLISNDTIIQDTKEELQGIPFVRDTDDTLLGLSGCSSYDSTEFLRYLLTSYNVISLDEINSTHIVGPIISKNTAERHKPNGILDGYLACADYTKGISSYIGNFTHFVEKEIETPGVKLNYGMDIGKNAMFNPPKLYTDTGIFMHVKSDGNNIQDYYILEDGTEVISSNNTGYSPTYQTDEFIDFTAFENALKNLSQEVLDSGNAESYDETVKYVFDTDGTAEGTVIEVYIDGTLDTTINSTNGNSYDGRGFNDFVYIEWESVTLRTKMETSWTIKNATFLTTVDLLTPDDYHYYNNPYLSPTTINFECSEINPAIYKKDIDGDGIKEEVSHSRTPLTYINGKPFDAKQGEDGEFGEVGNKIIWNMPNVVTNSETGENRLSPYGWAQNIAGHIIAPQAEFWNYNQALWGADEWFGGNLNGAAIVKSFYSGTMEVHMWPYDGRAEQATVFGVEALKTLNGGLPEREYKFLLDVERDSDGNSIYTEGVLNNVFPMSANSRITDGEQGVIKFSSIAFNKEGTYSFYVYEDIPDLKETDNVIYDQTKYRIDITVGKEVTGSGDTEKTTYYIVGSKKYKVVGSDGEPLDPIQDDVTQFVFNNRTTDQELPVELRLYKESIEGHVLAGAKFHVSEMTSATDETKPQDGYYEIVTSDTKGIIDIVGLEKDKYYKIEEFEAPQGYVLPNCYWIAHIGPKGFLLTLTQKETDKDDVIITDDILVNAPIEEVKLDVTLTKKNQFNVLLQGVDFRLQRVVIKDGVPEVVHNAFDETYITSVEGTISITGLEANHVYMLTETQGLAGYVEYTGYWIITVDEDLNYTLVEYDQDNKVVGDVTNNTLHNEKVEFKLPTTGGIGTNIYYIIGTALMILSFVVFKRKILKY